MPDARLDRTRRAYRLDFEPEGGDCRHAFVFNVVNRLYVCRFCKVRISPERIHADDQARRLAYTGNMDQLVADGIVRWVKETNG